MFSNPSYYLISKTTNDHNLMNYSYAFSKQKLPMGIHEITFKTVYTCNFLLVSYNTSLYRDGLSNICIYGFRPYSHTLYVTNNFKFFFLPRELAFV